MWPIALVVLLPMIIGLPVRAIYEALPDLTLGVAVVALLEMALALLRLRFIHIAPRAESVAGEVT